MNAQSSAAAFYGDCAVIVRSCHISQVFHVESLKLDTKVNQLGLGEDALVVCMLTVVFAIRFRLPSIDFIVIAPMLPVIPNFYAQNLSFG